MDFFYLLISLLLIIVGIIGCFFPIIPGPLTGWFGFLFLYQIEGVKSNKTLLLITFLIALFVFIFDYIMPLIGIKIFGGSKKGLIGASIGLVLGIIFLGPFGLILGAFLGSLFGEIVNKKKFSLAFKASIGTIIGVITGFILKFTVGCLFLIIYIYEIFKLQELIF